MQNVTVWREAKVRDGSEETYKIRLGDFYDGYHAGLFAKAIMNEAWENDLSGTIAITYDFTAEE